MHDELLHGRRRDDAVIFSTWFLTSVVENERWFLKDGLNGFDDLLAFYFVGEAESLLYKPRAIEGTDIDGEKEPDTGISREGVSFLCKQVERIE